jgi:hypothetical protein
MTTITIPKNLIKGDLMIVPRGEYEDFLNYKIKLIKEIKLMPSRKKKIQAARNRIAKGKFYTINELKNKLDIKS